MANSNKTSAERQARLAAEIEKVANQDIELLNRLTQ
jgi:hypothetical protein